MSKEVIPMEQIYVIKTMMSRGKRPMVVGVIKAATLTKRYRIPRRDTRKKTGYQREASSSRVNRLAKELSQNRVDLPTAVLLNLREYDQKTHLVERNGNYYFCLNDESLLYVVDGQHRIEALNKLIEEDPDRWENFEVPFVCMLGADEREEMEQFYIVNSTAKSVRTDLALDLLRQRAETDPEVMNSLLERGESWKVDAQALTEELSHTQLWRNRIRFPGQPSGETTIVSSGMALSLKQLLSTPYFGSVKMQNQVKVLDAYWQGIRKVVPEAFDNPSDYALQKSTGVQVMHALLVSVIEYIRSKGWSVTDPESYERALREPLQKLEGDTSTGDVASGVGFWRSGSEGAAGSYSSNAGRRVLIAKLKGLLPEVEVE